MREILFRGKRLDNGNWYYGGYFRAADGVVWVLGDDRLTYRPDAIEINPETLGQYTGLTDKNGKQIYEGDILRENESFFAVVYDQNWAKFRLQHDKRSIQYPEWNRGVLMEIVGNVYDN